MFHQFKKLDNKSGIVLFLVLMTAIIIMIFSVGILTQSMNEMNYAQQQIDQIASDEWAKGVWWNEYSSAYNAMSIESYQSGVARNYIINMAPLTTINGITTYNVVVNYSS